MQSLTLFLALTIALAAPPVLAQTIRIRDENIPGKLESFLIATPNASLNKKVLAILESSGKATFTGIVATDPNTQAKVKGLEIHLEEGDLKTVAYLDEFALCSFTLRCRACHGERLYTVLDVIDCDGSPRIRGSQSRKSPLKISNRLLVELSDQTKEPSKS